MQHVGAGYEGRWSEPPAHLQVLYGLRQAACVDEEDIWLLLTQQQNRHKPNATFPASDISSLP